MRTIILTALLAGCVVRYGAGTGSIGSDDPKSQPVDFTEIERRIERLVEDETDLDRRDRLSAAWDLVRRMKTQHPVVQHEVVAYLEYIVEIEERNVPRSAPVLVVPPNEDAGSDSIAVESLGAGMPIVVEEIAVVESPAPAPAEEPGEIVAEAPLDGPGLLRAAREALAAGKPGAGVDLLERCRDQPCWAEVETLWRECRDRFVYAERERAGEMYRAAREDQDLAQRAKVLRRARAILTHLRDTYPDSRYTEGIRSNLELVQRDLTKLEEPAQPAPK